MGKLLFYKALQAKKRWNCQTWGIRLGSPAMTTRGLKEIEFKKIGMIISKALKNKDNEEVLKDLQKEVLDLTSKYPLNV